MGTLVPLAFVSRPMKLVVALVLAVAVACSGGGVEIQATGPAETPVADPTSTPAADPPDPPVADPAPTPTPVADPAPTPVAGGPQLLAISVSRSDCPDGVCSRTEVWSDGTVRRDDFGGSPQLAIGIATADELAALVAVVDGFPEPLTGLVRHAGQPLLCRPEVDGGGRQALILRGGRLDIVDTCWVEGPEVDELFDALSAVTPRSPAAAVDGARPLADVQAIGGCNMIGSCPRETLWTDGRWASWSLDPSEDFYGLASGAASATDVAALASRIAESDLEALRSELGPGTCHACVDGVNEIVELHVGGAIESFSDIDYQLEGAPLFDELFAVLGAAGPATPFATILELNGVYAPAGRYVTIGHLVFADDCGYCPEGALCEACAGPVVSVLSERPDLELVHDGSTTSLTDQLGPTELALNVNLENEQDLVVPGRYEMTVELTDVLAGATGHRLATVLSFRELP